MSLVRRFREFTNESYGLTPQQVTQLMRSVYMRGDRLLGYFILVHVALAILHGFVYSTWAVTIPVTLAAAGMFLTSVVLLPATQFTRYVAGISLQTFVALHIYQMHGMSEMHFYFFTAQTMLLVYEDWLATWPGTWLIIGQHILFAVLQNTGSNLSFFPESYITVRKLFFHFGIALWQVSICSCWAILHRRRRLKAERQRIEVETSRRIAEDATLSRSQFTANMSHEIRTPMNVLIGMSGLLMESGLTADQKDYAQTIHKGAEALLVVINDVLDLSKLEAGRLEIDPADFSVDSLVEDTCNFLVLHAHRKGLELTCFISPEMPAWLRGDAGRLRQILTNLIGNAVKFTAKGEVNLQVNVSGQVGRKTLVTFAVSDTGIGIAPDVQQRLFQAFTQADGSTTRKYGGSGLGLVISKRMATLMNGTISVESELGKGSRFALQLPFDQPSGTQHTEARTAPELEGVRVLVVDDNESSLTMLQQYLKMWRAIPDSATNGLQAIRRIREAAAAGEPYGLIVLDCGMPEMSGMDVVRIIKSNPGLESTPVIMLTTFDERREIRAAEDGGVNAFLSKPLRREQFRQSLVRAINKTPDAETEQPQESKMTKDYRGVKLLLVEDNEDNQRLAVRLLAKHGYKCDIASNGREALVRLASERYPLVLMDCQMPEMDGFQATAAIREREKANENARQTPIIALTAHALAGDRKKCLEAGMDDYLSKPINEEGMIRTIEHWLSDGAHVSGLENKSPAVALKPADRIPIHANAGLKDLIPGYLSNRQNDLISLSEAVKNGDMDAARRIGHGMKGSGGGYGFPAITEFGRCIEQSAVTQDAATLERQIVGLEEYLSKIEVIY